MNEAAEVEERKRLIDDARRRKWAAGDPSGLSEPELDAVLPGPANGGGDGGAGLGRPRKLTSFQRARLRRLAAAGAPIDRIASELRISETSVYRHLREDRDACSTSRP